MVLRKKVLLTTETTSYAAGKQKRSKAVECHYEARRN